MTTNRYQVYPYAIANAEYCTPASARVAHAGCFLSGAASLGRRKEYAAWIEATPRFVIHPTPIVQKRAQKFMHAAKSANQLSIRALREPVPENSRRDVYEMFSCTHALS